MKNLSNLVFLILLSAILNSSCQKDEVEGFDPGDTTPIFTFTKTPCFGFCEAYEYKLYANGLSCFRDFYGQSELKERSSTTSNCKFQKIELWNSIKNKALELEIFSLNDSYPIDELEIPDLSIQKIYIKVNGVEKRITNSYGAPARLTQFETFAHKLVMEFKATLPLEEKITALEGHLNNID